MDIYTAAAMERPAISIAAWKGDVDALRRELTRGVAVDLADPSGNTALQIVCGAHNADLSLEDRIACVKLLLEHGAAPNAGLPNHPGHSTVEGAVNETPLMDIIIAPCPTIKIAQMLIAAGSDVNGYIHEFYPHPEGDVDMGYSSPLSSALTASFFDEADGFAVVNLLLKAGADPNPPEHRGLTVMEEAIYMGLRRFWPVLLRAGAVLPTRVIPRREYRRNRANPYFLRVESAGGFEALERAQREQLLATFTPKFTHLVPPELVPLIVEYAFHVRFY